MIRAYIVARYWHTTTIYMNTVPEWTVLVRICSVSFVFVCLFVCLFVFVFVFVLFCFVFCFLFFVFCFCFVLFCFVFCFFVFAFVFCFWFVFGLFLVCLFVFCFCFVLFYFIFFFCSVLFVYFSNACLKNTDVAYISSESVLTFHITQLFWYVQIKGEMF